MDGAPGPKREYFVGGKGIRFSGPITLDMLQQGISLLVLNLRVIFELIKISDPPNFCGKHGKGRKRPPFI